MARARALTMRDRLLGILLFLPVPLVLWLFTRAPLGVATSLGTGLVVMALHPLYARPFALRRAAHRCLWCGGRLDPSARIDRSAAIEVREPRGRTRWRACRASHRHSLDHLLRFAGRRARGLRVGILGSLFVLLAGGALIAIAGDETSRFIRVGPMTVDFEDVSAVFRLAVALTVLPLGWFGARAPSGGVESLGADEPIPTPFPVHIQALIGTRSVVWLFRAIGILWLAQGLRHFLAR